ncbi:MAG: hypothetical protein ACLQVI_07925 [Polyangiaceae bacterium]
MGSPTDEEIRAMTPGESGFNVVQFNRDARPGKRLTFIDNYPTRAEAERIAGEMRLADSGRKYLIYGPLDVN